MSLFSPYIEGGDEVFTREARRNILATSRIDLVSDLIVLRSGSEGLIYQHPERTTVADSANDPAAGDYTTGFINCTGGGADTWTLPTGAALADAMPGSAVSVGDMIRCVILNDSGGAITLEAGASGSTITNATSDLTVEDGQLAELLFVFDGATDGSETYTVLLNKSA